MRGGVQALPSSRRELSLSGDRSGCAPAARLVVSAHRSAYVAARRARAQAAARRAEPRAPQSSGARACDLCHPPNSALRKLSAGRGRFADSVPTWPWACLREGSFSQAHGCLCAGPHGEALTQSPSFGPRSVWHRRPRTAVQDDTNAMVSAQAHKTNWETCVPAWI